VIVLAMRWYLRFYVSYRDVEELLLVWARMEWNMGVTRIGGAFVRRRLRGRSSAMMMGGWLLVSLSMATVAGCAAGERGQVLRRRLTVLGDDEHRELGARR
jgi:hypothetical protein